MNNLPNDVQLLQKMVINYEQDLEKAMELLKEISNWLVCECIATPEDMAQSFTPFREEIDKFLYGEEVKQ